MEMLKKVLFVIMAFVPCVTGMALPTFASEKKEIYNSVIYTKLEHHE